MKPTSEKSLVRQPSTEFSREQQELIRRTIARGANDDELALFLRLCQRTGLDPFSRQAYLIRRWDSREKREVMTAQTSIDGFRLLADRSGRYVGQVGPFWCGPDGVWRDVWIEDAPPVAAKVGVLKTGCREPFWGIAKYAEYVQTDRDGNPLSMWRKMPANQLAKCSEALALRKGFPQELANLYTQDEMGQTDRDADPPPTVNIAAPEPAKPQPNPEPPARPWRTFKEMIGEFSKLRDRLKGEDDIYYEVLSEYGVQHSNQFQDGRKAAQAYQKLLARVREYEAAQQPAEEPAMIDPSALIEEIRPPDEEAIP
jgi:phage recombination protein Bet